MLDAKLCKIVRNIVTESLLGEPGNPCLDGLCRTARNPDLHLGTQESPCLELYKHHDEGHFGKARPPCFDGLLKTGRNIVLQASNEGHLSELTCLYLSETSGSGAF